MSKTPKSRPRKSKPREVWVVLHCDYMRNPKHGFIDEMLFHVASYLEAAEKFIRTPWVAPYSWWEIQRRFLDVRDDDEAPERYFYSQTGRPRKKQPYAHALKAYKKWWAAQPDSWKSGDPD